MRAQNSKNNEMVKGTQRIMAASGVAAVLGSMLFAWGITNFTTARERLAAKEAALRARAQARSQAAAAQAVAQQESEAAKPVKAGGVFVNTLVGALKVSDASIINQTAWGFQAMVLGLALFVTGLTALGGFTLLHRNLKAKQSAPAA